MGRERHRRAERPEVRERPRLANPEAVPVDLQEEIAGEPRTCGEERIDESTQEKSHRMPGLCFQ